MKVYSSLTKQGIVLFVLASGLAGYGLSLPYGYPIELWQPLLLCAGLYLVSSGSFALNQAQEWRLDKKMSRTASRPIPTGRIQAGQGYALGFVLCLFGLLALFLLSRTSGYLALMTLILYNGFYTLFWKKKWVFAAVPGALPGALPVLIGYAGYESAVLFSSEACYLFLLMFLWQMPHFWSLSIRYRKDYSQGNIPVLPVKLGIDKTLYHIGLYIFPYIGLVLAAPLFVPVSYLHLFLVIPFAFKVAWEFMWFFKKGSQKWLSFFLWVNVSLLVFLTAPIFDKWMFLYP